MQGGQTTGEDYGNCAITIFRVPGRGLQVWPGKALGAEEFLGLLTTQPGALSLNFDFFLTVIQQLGYVSLLKGDGEPGALPVALSLVVLVSFTAFMQVCIKC